MQTGIVKLFDPFLSRDIIALALLLSTGTCTSG
jgi:hypothetical protein